MYENSPWIIVLGHSHTILTPFSHVHVDVNMRLFWISGMTITPIPACRLLYIKWCNDPQKILFLPTNPRRGNTRMKIGNVRDKSASYYYIYILPNSLKMKAQKWKDKCGLWPMRIWVLAWANKCTCCIWMDVPYHPHNLYSICNCWQPTTIRYKCPNSVTYLNRTFVFD